MSEETVQVEFVRSWGQYMAGDRTGLTEDAIETINRNRTHVKPITTDQTSQSKSDPEVRKSLKEEARTQEAERALGSGDYNEMKSKCAKLGLDAQGTKDELKKRLQEYVSGSEG